MGDKNVPDLMPQSIGLGILVIRLYRNNQSYLDIIPEDRSMKTAVHMAIDYLREHKEEFYKCEALGLMPSGLTIPYPDLHIFLQDAIPYYVRWKSDDGTDHEQRFVKRSSAFKFYSDLQKQDYQILTTNSHPQEKGH